MRVPIEWLTEFVPTKLIAEQLAERLTMAGLEVTGIERVDGEPILDLEITPNRADCLSIVGLAREVAALTGQRLKPPSALGSRLKAPGKSHRAYSLQPRAQVTIRIEDRQGCLRYLGRLIDDVRIGPSPAWMQRRLLACGVRPINNVVDVTNYVLLEQGQPLHAFDFDRFEKGIILVRRAIKREPITTLDGIHRALSPEVLVIADIKQAVAVAGVMGGMGSEVTPQTRRVLLESALFDPIVVRRAARRLGLSTESSYRFERGVDPAGVETASARASALICELAEGSEVALGEAGTTPSKRAGVILEANRLSRWLGLTVSPATIRTQLARLSCHVASTEASEALHVMAPSFRQDLKQDVDFFEELARVAGYERIPSTLPSRPIAPSVAGTSTSYERAQAIRSLCASLGLTEVMTWALVSERDLLHSTADQAGAVRLANPLSQDHAFLRPSLLGGLARVIQRNLAQGAIGVRIFELGNVFHTQEPRERLRLGVALAGVWARDWRRKDACDFFILKGLLQVLIERLCGRTPHISPMPQSWGEPGCSASVHLDGRLIGEAGQVARSLAAAFDLEQEVFVAELAVSELRAAARPSTAITAPTPFPPAKRDLSIVVRDETPFDAVARIVREIGGALAERIELIDRYAGSQVPSGSHSLTFSIEYRHASRTLTSAEVDALHRRIGQALVSQLHAQIR